MEWRIPLQGLVGKFMRDEIYSVIHKVAGLPAATLNGLWRRFMLVAPIHNQWDIFSGAVEWCQTKSGSCEASVFAALFTKLLASWFPDVP